VVEVINPKDWELIIEALDPFLSKSFQNVVLKWREFRGVLEEFY